MLKFRSITNLTFNNFTKKSKKESTVWMNEHLSDPYVRKAQMLNYRSRAAFKLIEIQHRYNIMKPGNKVLDLGSAPGSWTQVIVELTKSHETNPTVLGVDLLEVKKIKGAGFIQGDMESQETRVKMQEFFKLQQIDTIVCDAAPNFMGDKDVDHMGISVLNDIAVVISKNQLKTGGNLLMKTLQGTLENEYFKQYKNYFKNFQRIKPNASRSRSSEIYYLGRGFKLSEDYMKLEKIQNLINSNQTLKEFDQTELKQFKLDDENLIQILTDLYQMSVYVDDQDQIIQIKKLAKQLKIKIDFDNIQKPPKLENDADLQKVIL